jgi:hypothetical protein
MVGALAVGAACSSQGRVFVSTGTGGSSTSSSGVGGFGGGVGGFGVGGFGGGVSGVGGGFGGGSTTTSTGTTTCTPESDTALCVALGKTCEEVTGTDNCGTMRMVSCGTCTGTQACVSNVCQAPACASLSFSTTGTPISSVLKAGVQNVPAAVTPSGGTLLVQQGNACAPYDLYVADETAPGSLSYTMLAVDAPAGMNVSGEEQQTLTADGLTLIATNTAGTAFLSASRTAAGQADFVATKTNDYAAITVGAGQTLFAPAISEDGLAFYYTVYTPVDGGQATPIYESLRTSTSVPFPAGTLMPAPVNSYYFVTGISSDRMTLFVQNSSFAVFALTRTSLTEPYANPNAPAAAPSIPGFRTRPLANCQTLIGTCHSGCVNEEICTYPAM